MRHSPEATAVVGRLLDDFHARVPIRAGSLIVTLFGDAVAPRGGRLSLASLVDIMAAMRIGGGLVRTAMSRLVADGWFERWKLGRNSFYRLSREGALAFAAATERIYGRLDRRWEGSFDLVLLQAGDGRPNLRAEYERRGYGAVAPGLLLSPAPAPGREEQNDALHLTAKAGNLGDARRLAERAWPLRDLDARYRSFAERFTPAVEASHGMRGVADPEGDLEALVVRVLLIHEYRRLVLRDPLLPFELLPADWAGAEARRLCGGLYRSLVPGSERWLDRHATNDDGPLPEPGREFRTRFADLG